jgi:RNA recognition motif-containing protein
MNIFVASLPFAVSSEDLNEVFSEYGEVVSAKVITDKFTGKSKGFGFVEMADENEGSKAIKELDGASIEGRQIVVKKAQPKKF